MARPKEDDNLTDKTRKQQTNINSIPNIYDMYKNRQELASGEYAEQLRLAEQQANIARDSLAKQVERQRYDYLRGQQAALDSGYDRGRRLTNALANRGLMTSGMLQLGDVQNRMATGQTLSSLAEANRDVTESALQAEQAIARGLVDIMNKAGLDYQRGMLDSDQMAFSQDQALKAQQMDYALALLDSLRDENLDPATRDALLSIMSPYLGDVQSGDGGSLLDTIKGVTPSTAGEIGDTKFTRGLYVGSELFGDYGLRYNIPGVGKQRFDSVEDAIDAVSKLYSDKPHSDKIKVVQQRAKTGGSNYQLLFEVNGRQFDTYNKALNYLTNVVLK